MRPNSSKTVTIAPAMPAITQTTIRPLYRRLHLSRRGERQRDEVEDVSDGDEDADHEDGRRDDRPEDAIHGHRAADR